MSGEKAAIGEKRLEGGPCRGPWGGTRCEESLGLKWPEGNRSQQVGEA